MKEVLLNLGLEPGGTQIVLRLSINCRVVKVGWGCVRGMTVDVCHVLLQY